MKHRHDLLIGACAASLALFACLQPALAQSGSVLSDTSDVELQQKVQAQAAEKIKCAPLADAAKAQEAFASAVNDKWDRAAVGCAIEYGLTAFDALPQSDERKVAFGLELMGAIVSYFDVIDKSYNKLYESTDTAAELSLRWETNRANGEKVLAALEPAAADVVEFRLLSAAFKLASSQRGVDPMVQGKLQGEALAGLQGVMAEKPEALGGLAPLLMGQLLYALPGFLGGDVEKAGALFEQARSIDPNNLAAYRGLVEYHLKKREPEKVAAVLEAALKVDPQALNAQDFVDDAQFLGGLAVRAGREDLAASFNSERAKVLAEKPYLQTRKKAASFGHGAEDPFTGKDSNELK